MLLTLLRRFCGFLACVMCIFILGPIAMIIECIRIVRSWVMMMPHDYTNFQAVYPMFITFAVLIFIVVAVSQI